MIVPAASTAEMLGGCLASLARFGPTQIEYETIVVLNEAAPDIEAELRQKVTGVEVVASPVNLGMAGAGNLGRAHARGELLVALHDDAAIEPGWLEALVETADAYPEAGAIGGTVLFPDGRLQHAGLILWRDGTTSLPWIGDAPSPTAFDRLRPVDYCGTSSLLVRTAAWDAVGGLDEQFYPAYYVDVDLSMALRQQNWVVLYQPRSRIRHHQGSSSSLRLRSFIQGRNRQLFVEKWAAALDAHRSPIGVLSRRWNERWHAPKRLRLKVGEGTASRRSPLQHTTRLIPNCSSVVTSRSGASLIGLMRPILPRCSTQRNWTGTIGGTLVWCRSRNVLTWSLTRKQTATPGAARLWHTSKSWRSTGRDQQRSQQSNESGARFIGDCENYFIKLTRPERHSSPAPISSKLK